MVGFAGWYGQQPYRDILFYTPFQHLFLVGPVIFFYVQSLLNPSFKITKNHYPHFAPAAIYLLYSLVMVVTDKLILKKYYFLADGSDRDFDTWYQIVGFISMLIYFIAAIKYYNLYKKLMLQIISYADEVLFKWVRNFLIAFCSILILNILLFIFSAIFKLHYTNIWWYYLGFSITFYYIAVTGYSNAIITKVPFRASIFNSKPTLLLSNASTINESQAAIETDFIEIIEEEINIKQTEELVAWKNKIENLILNQKLYEEPELSLPDVAKKLKTNVSVLSKNINQGFGMNFNDFINQYRVKAVMEMLQNGEHKNQTLIGIAYDCGFNSKATFNRAFKKFNGTAPKDWIEENEA